MIKPEKEWLKESTEYCRAKINSNNLLESLLSAMEARLRELEAADAEPGQFGRFWDYDKDGCAYGRLVRDESQLSHCDGFNYLSSINRGKGFKDRLWFKHFEPLTEPTWEPPKKGLVPYIKDVEAFMNWYEAQDCPYTTWLDFKEKEE